MKKLFVWIVLAGCMLHTNVSAANLTDTTETVKHFMQKVQQAYRDAPYLSFRLLYRYANKNQPTNYIDSMAGDIAMDKNRMRLVMDDIETITNDKYTIQ